MISCPKCGKENQDHYKFCLGCGNELPRDGGLARPFHPTPPAGVPAAGAAGGAPRAAPSPFGSAPASPGPSPFGGAPASPGPSPFGGAPASPGPSPFGGAPASPGPGAAPASAAPAAAPVAPAGQSRPASRTCAVCGSANPANNRFCITCGNDLNAPGGVVAAASPVASAPPAAVPAAPAVPGPSGVSSVAGVPPVAPAVPGPVGGVPAAVPQTSRARLVLIRPDGTEGGTFPLNEGSTTIGRSTGPLFAADSFLSPRHATFTVHGNTVTVRDEGSLNGVYVRIERQSPVELQNGDIFRIGQEILRYEAYGPVRPEPDGTERQGAQIEGLMGRISLVVGREATGNAFPVPVTGLYLGRERGDILFPEDGYVSGLHCQLSVEGGKLMLTDVGSSNGTYLRIRGERVLRNNDLLLMGQQLFRLVVG